MESVYSLLQKAPATILDHETTLRILIEKITSSNMVRVQNYRFDVQGFIIDWVRRDLLNIIFGNSDNHGRNTAFMKADPEGIPRTMKWSLACESGGEYNFGAIAQALAEWIAPDTLLNALSETASQLVDLPSRLKVRGVPVQILEMPSIGFKFIPDKLARWGLL